MSKDKLTRGENENKKVSIPGAIKETLLPMFKDVSDLELIEKFSQEQTQNIHELLNGAM